MLMTQYTTRLQSLRDELKKQGLTGFVIPICDEHMSEYIGGYAQRLEWLTGFGGSAGSVVVMAEKAAIFIDGRYTIQVRDQVDGTHYEYVSTAKTSVTQWLKDNCDKGDVIGYDAWLHTVDFTNELEKQLTKKGASAKAVDSNPVDAIWHDQPARPLAKAQPHAIEYAGKSSEEKRQDIAKWLGDEGLDAVVISALDSIAWTLNIRGEDISHTPVAISYAIVHKNGHADLFIAPDKVSEELQKHLGNQVTIAGYDDFSKALGDYKGKKIAVDPERAVAAIFQILDDAGAQITRRRDPSVLAKALKNQAEISGHRAAQARDGAAVSKFLQWLSVEGPKESQDELSAAAKLLSFREETGVLKDTSFDTISGASANGAQCHYRVNEETNRKITQNTLYLVDLAANISTVQPTLPAPSPLAPPLRK